MIFPWFLRFHMIFASPDVSFDLWEAWRRLNLWRSCRRTEMDWVFFWWLMEETHGKQREMSQQMHVKSCKCKWNDDWCCLLKNQLTWTLYTLTFDRVCAWLHFFPTWYFLDFTRPCFSWEVWKSPRQFSHFGCPVWGCLMLGSFARKWQRRGPTLEACNMNRSLRRSYTL